MAVPTLITDCNATLASNSPAGTDSVGTNMDDYFRAAYGFIAQLLAATQSNAYTAFTTAGTDTAFTLTPSPAITALAANQRFRVKFNAASGATPTLAVSGLTAKNLKYYDSTGAKQAITSAQVPLNWVSDVEYDGTDWVVLQVPAASGLLVTTASLAGYTTGSGGTVTQATDKTTAVTLNKPTGLITTASGSIGADTRVSFTLNNSLIEATSLVLVQPVGSGAAGVHYNTYATQLGAGSTVIVIHNSSAGALNEVLSLRFHVFKGASA